MSYLEINQKFSHLESLLGRAIAVQSEISQDMQKILLQEKVQSLTQIEAAKMLGVSDRTLRRKIKAGEIRLNAAGKIPLSEVKKTR